MKEKTINEIKDQMSKIDLLDKFDVIVAIGRGGVIPGRLVSEFLSLPLKEITINFRNDKHEVQHQKPQIINKLNFDTKNKRILIVDDVSRTGETLKIAKGEIKEAKEVKTFVVNGKADYSLFDEECFKFPW